MPVLSTKEVVVRSEFSFHDEREPSAVTGDVFRIPIVISSVKNRRETIVAAFVFVSSF